LKYFKSISKQAVWIEGKKKPGRSPAIGMECALFRQNLQRGTLTARQWEEEMRTGDVAHMKFRNDDFKK